MELRTKSLFCGSQFWISASSGIDSKNRSASKTENVVVLKMLDDVSVHLSKLTAVALVKHKNNVLVINRMGLVFRNEHIQFLNGCYDNSGSAVLKLSLQDCGTLIAVGSTFLKTVIFLNGLVVQILAVNHKEHLVHIGKARGKLGCLEGSQCFAGTRGVPDIAPAFHAASLFIVVGYFQSLQNALSGRYLIRTHHQQHFLGSEHTEPGKDMQ